MASERKRKLTEDKPQKRGLEFYFDRQRKRQNQQSEKHLLGVEPEKDPLTSNEVSSPLTSAEEPAVPNEQSPSHDSVMHPHEVSLTKLPETSRQLSVSHAASSEEKSAELLLEDPLLFQPENYPVQSWMTPKGISAPYSILAETFSIIMSTTARTKMINVLCNLLRVLIVHAPGDLLSTLWLCSNSLGPSYEGMELGIGSQILSKSIGDVSGTTPRQLKHLYEKHGDWGDVAYAAKTSVRTIVEPKRLRIQGVLDALHAIAAAKGKGTVGIKTAAVKKLLLAAKGEEARFIVRTLIANLRVGALRTTVLTALARASVLTQARKGIEGQLIRRQEDSTDRVLNKMKQAEAVLKECYAQCPNWNAIVPWLIECGDVGRIFERCGLTVGIPLKPMLGQITRELTDVFVRLKFRDFACEWKYDGQRAQIHMDENGQVVLFSRNLENMSDKYPDITAMIPRVCDPSIKSFIIDSEIVAISEEGNILPFQILSNRSRKNVTVDSINVQVCVLAFDLMYINNESLLQQSFRERRDLLKKHFTPLQNRFDFVATMDASGDDCFLEKVEDFFRDSIRRGTEGIMVKVLDHPSVIARDDRQRGKSTRHLLSTYEPDKRVESWLKVKKDYIDGIGDTLDLIPIGAWYGNGRKVNWYSPILMACYNPDNGTLESVCKCMSGFSDKYYQEMKEYYSKENNRILPEPRSDYVTDLQPDGD
ncbi:hypothetical protein EC973_004586 [Apophysomyces ossiformis]|uniref:DNA ligase n=1 Tax=Apophysomyces ossiformis TaxID=679940 RepID=A0A8H7BSN4_9FUNG|nr:hypothetical protein EC973_004586 [Apophysomyces ossiformis]